MVEFGASSSYTIVSAHASYPRTRVRARAQGRQARAGVHMGLAQVVVGTLGRVGYSVNVHSWRLTLQQLNQLTPDHFDRHIRYCDAKLSL